MERWFLRGMTFALGAFVTWTLLTEPTKTVVYLLIGASVVGLAALISRQPAKGSSPK